MTVEIKTDNGQGYVSLSAEVKGKERITIDTIESGNNFTAEKIAKHLELIAKEIRAV